MSTYDKADAEPGASSMHGTGLFRYSCQRRFVDFREGDGNRTVRLEDRFDETGSLRASVFDPVVRNEAAHDTQGVFLVGTRESFELIR